MPADPILKMSLKSFKTLLLPWCDIFMCYHGYSFDTDSMIFTRARWRWCISAERAGVPISAQTKKKIWGYLSIEKTIKN